MIDALYTTIIGHVIEIFFIVASIIGLYVIKYIKDRLTASQQAMMQEIVRSGVLYIQQTMPDDKPIQKLESAVANIVVALDEKGIPVDEHNIYMQIESNLKELKKDFGEQWGK